MKKIYLLFILFSSTLITASAQNTDWIFHTYHHDTFNEDKAYAVTTTKEGGYVIAGKYGVNGIGNGDVLIVKLSSSGTIVWSKTYADSLGDEARSIKELADGSFILSGFTYKLGGANPDNSYKNLLMRLTSTGDTLWTRRFGGTGIFAPEGLGSGVDTTADGGFVMVGKYPVSGGNGNDFFIIKTNANGDSLWSKIYGGSGSDIPRSIIQTADSGFIISGTTKSYGPDPSRGNMWLLKTDSKGDTTWTKVIGSANDEECFMARPTADGGYILAGRTGNNSDLKSDLFIVKTNSKGDSLWSRSWGHPTENDFGRDVVQTADKGYALIGARNATHGYYLLFPLLMYVVKTDSMGAKEWDKELGFDNSPNGANGLSIANTPDGGLIAAGFDQPDTASGGTEEIRAFVVKFAPLGVSVMEEQGTSLQAVVYPNPFSETATLLIPADINGVALLDIYNVAGQLVISKQIEAGKHIVTVYKRELTAGMYFFRLHVNKGSADYRGKLLVE